MLSMKLACQSLLILFTVMSILTTIRHSINGRERMQPDGFRGVVYVLIAAVVIFALYWKVGALSELVH